MEWIMSAGFGRPNCYIITMLKYLVEYEVKPGDNLPDGLPKLRLVVLSPIWRGPALDLEYPDGDTETITGVTMSGDLCDVQVFWTRENPGGPAVCLAIGGDAGLQAVTREGNRETSRGLAFMALAESLIPGEVLVVIGPPPLIETTPLLLG
jgi:hypothetical protein